MAAMAWKPTMKKAPCAREPITNCYSKIEQRCKREPLIPMQPAEHSATSLYWATKHLPAKQ